MRGSQPQTAKEMMKWLQVTGCQDTDSFFFFFTFFRMSSTSFRKISSTLKLSLALASQNRIPAICCANCEQAHGIGVCVCVCVCARACWARRGRHVSSISTGSVTGRGNSSWALGFRQRLGRKVWKVLFILKCKAHLHLNFNVGKCSNFLHDEKSAKHKL